MQYARDNNDSNEIAFVFRKDLTDKSVFLGSDNVVDFGNELFGKGDGLFIMHNHPRNSSFSNADIVQFISENNIKHMSVVKNNGMVEILSKTNMYDQRTAVIEWQRAIDKYVARGISSEYDVAMKKLIAKLNKKGYVRWIN